MGAACVTAVRATLSNAQANTSRSFRLQVRYLPTCLPPPLSGSCKDKAHDLLPVTIKAAGRGLPLQWSMAVSELMTEMPSTPHYLRINRKAL